MILHKSSVCRPIYGDGKKIKKMKKSIFFCKNLLTNGKKDDKIVNCIIIARIVGSCFLRHFLHGSKLHKKRKKIVSRHSGFP